MPLRADPGTNGQMAEEACVAGDDTRLADLVELSVVLVATANNPSIINPDFLADNDIVDKHRQSARRPGDHGDHTDEQRLACMLLHLDQFLLRCGHPVWRPIQPTTASIVAERCHGCHEPFALRAKR